MHAPMNPRARSEIQASISESGRVTSSKPTGPHTRPKKMKRVMEGMPRGDMILPNVWPAMHTVQKPPKVTAISAEHSPRQFIS